MTENQFRELLNQLQYLPLTEKVVILTFFKTLPEQEKQELIIFYQNQLAQYLQAKTEYEQKRQEIATNHLKKIATITSTNSTN